MEAAGAHDPVCFPCRRRAEKAAGYYVMDESQRSVETRTDEMRVNRCSIKLIRIGAGRWSETASCPACWKEGESIVTFGCRAVAFILHDSTWQFYRASN